LKRLIIRPGGIGDCILALPAMEWLNNPLVDRRSSPVGPSTADTTEVWVPSANAPLIRFADSVRAIASTGLDLLGIPDRDPPPGVLDTLARFDSIVSWYGTHRPEFRDYVAGLPFRFLDALPDRSGVHAADFYLRQVGPDSGPAIPRIECPQAERAGFVAIHPFSGSAKKNWPLERFRDLARRLDLPVRWCAGPEEPLDDAQRFDNLYALACWLRSARLYIGNDSGITHLAAAVGTPVLALFGPTDPAIWAPRGEHVSIVATARPGQAMEGISVDEVLRATR
jgi:ADP-heptose:LPS heptosyltransferase